MTPLPEPEQLSRLSLQPLENRRGETSKDIQERKDIPIVFAVEMSSQLTAPIIGDILSLFMDWSMDRVYVVSNFMIENFAGEDVPKHRDPVPPSNP